MDAAKLRPDLRDVLEGDLRAMAAEGHIPDRGERDLRIRIDPEGHIRWFECVRRVPASELESEERRRSRLEREERFRERG